MLPRHDFCRYRADQRHTAGCLAAEVQITYPYHPRHGEMVAVVGAKRHAGSAHLVIRQPDRTLCLIPKWMTEPAGASADLVSDLRLPVQQLVHLRALIDSLVASSGGESSRRDGVGHEERAMPPKGSVQDGNACPGSTSGTSDETSASSAGAAARRRRHQASDRGAKIEKHGERQ